MKCSDVTPLLSLYIDEQLEAHKMDKIKEHLHSCDYCIKEYDELKALLAGISEIPQLDMPSNFSQSLHLRLEQEAANMANPTVVHFKTVWDKLKEHRRVPISIGLVAACMLIVFSTGIFNNIKTTDYSHQQPEITQNAPDPKTSTQPPASGGTDVTLQARQSPFCEIPTVTPQPPTQSKVPQNSAQPTYQAPIVQQTPALSQPEEVDVTPTPTPAPSADSNTIKNTAAPDSIAVTDDKTSNNAQTSGSSNDVAVSALTAPRLRMSALGNNVLAKTMYVETKDPKMVIDALGEMQKRITQENDRSVLTLTEEEYNQLEKIIIDMGGNLNISYGFENSDNPAHSFKIVIVNQ